MCGVALARHWNATYHFVENNNISCIIHLIKWKTTIFVNIFPRNIKYFGNCFGHVINLLIIFGLKINLSNNTINSSNIIVNLNNKFEPQQRWKELLIIILAQHTFMSRIDRPFVTHATNPPFPSNGSYLDFKIPVEPRNHTSSNNRGYCPSSYSALFSSCGPNHQKEHLHRKKSSLSQAVQQKIKQLVRRLSLPQKLGQSPQLDF